MIKFLYNMETTAIGKSFKQNQIKSRKYFSTHQYQNFRKFQHQTSTMEQNKETKKKESWERYSTNFSSSKVYC